MNRQDVNLNVIKALMTGKALDKELLKEYTGWGGLKKAMYTPAFYLELKKFLNDDEILLIKKTLSNAYYTPQPIIAAMYRYLSDAAGFRGGKILEPAAGHGAFIEYMPDTIRKKSKMYAVELEPVSAKILTALYPDVVVKNGGFETLDIKPVFDLIIGNPPYGKNMLVDAYHTDLNHLVIHHYFVAKSMRLLKQGGLLAMVLPAFFMDNRRDHARGIIAQEGGCLLNAFRLPENLFSDAKVTVDLVFLQKGGESQNDWVETGKTEVNGEYFSISNYFLKNKAHILGDLSWVHAYGRKLLTCVNSTSPYDDLNTLFGRLVRVRPRGVLDLQEVLSLIDFKMGLLQARREDLLKLENNLQGIAAEVKGLVVE